MNVSRRDFTITAALALLSSGAAGVASAENPPAAKPAGEAPAAPTLSPALQAEAEARIQWILAKYGSRFSDEQKADLRRIITGSMGGFEALRAYPLDNSVEPATIFRPYRSTKRRPSKIVTHERGEKS
ncbi:MAG TPA: hypothetical protein VFN10_07555 [Thermoanaerobaculia bacterium]|nr:hypothetical protein [Thermoanaerobaculia bacterium]